MALVVEAEAVDHRLVLDQPEDARLGVAGLRLRRDGADLGKAEAEPEQRVRHLGILVVAGRNAERIGKGEAGDGLRQPRIGSGGAGRHEAGFQRLDRKAVRRLRIEAGTGRARASDWKAPIIASSSGKTWVPSAPSGSGFSHMHGIEAGAAA